MKTIKEYMPLAVRKKIRCAVEELSLPIGLKLRIGLPLSIEQRRGMIRYLINEHKVKREKEKVLFWRGPSRGSISVELMIALAMKLRGFDVQFVICDGALSGCIQRGVNKEPLERWNMQCASCVQGAVDVLESFSLSYVGIGELVSDELQKDLREVCRSVSDNNLDSYEYQDIPVGLFAKASTQRYLRGYSFNDNKLICKEYLYSSFVCAEAAEKCFKQLNPDRIFMQQHDFYVEWAPAFRVAMKMGLPVTFWGGDMYEDGGIALRQAKDTQYRSLLAKYGDSNGGMELTEKQNEELTFFLKKYYGKQKSYCKNDSKEKLLKKLGVNDKKPIWCIFAHVSWGEAANFDGLIYGDTVSWIMDTINITREIKDITWIIKIHPAERMATVAGMEDRIRESFPEMDWGNRIISADSNITIKDVFPILSGGITISGTPGVELALQGIPAIVTGRSHYRNCGFTYDVTTRDEYKKLLQKAKDIKPLSEEQNKMARQYAYSLFFKRRIPLNMGKGNYRFAPLDFRKLNLLLPGRDKAMDMICERIINGGEFIL